MKRILFIYELGDGFGHLNRLIAVAKTFINQYEIAFAVPQAGIAAPHLRAIFGVSIKIYNVYRWPIEKERATLNTNTFADVMYALDFVNYEKLLFAVKFWQRLLNEVRPDLIVADFAPTLRASANKNTPIVVVGNGYTVPPSGRSFPPIRPWITEVPLLSQKNEENVYSTINRIRKSMGLSDFDFCSDLFSGESTFVSTMKMFDPYRYYRKTEVFRPFNLPNIENAKEAHKDRLENEVFIYLPPSNLFTDLIIEAVSKLKMNFIAYIPGLDVTNSKKLRLAGVVMLDQPADFSTVLPRVALMLHHGGLATAYAGVLAGTPQFTVPGNLEHLITSRCLIDLGVARGISTNVQTSAKELGQGIRTTLADQNIKRAAMKVASEASLQIGRPGIPVVREKCLEYLQ